MSAIATAIVVTGVVGGAVAYESGKDATRSQKQATKAASEASAEQLAFQKEQYQDWQDVYGSTQDNLAEFYNSYDAEAVTSLGLQNIEREYTQSKNSLIQEMAQRGMDTSGLTAAGLTQLSGIKASEKAQVRASAPLQAAQAQQSFLGMGLGLESSLQQGIASSYGQQAGLQMQVAGQYGQQAAAASQGVGQAIGSIGSAMGTYAMVNAMQPTSAMVATAIPVANPAGAAIPAPTYIPNASQVIV